MIDVPRGTVVFNEGEPGDSLYIVLAGKIKLGRRTADGRENLVAVMGPSDQFGELSLFDPGPRTVDRDRGDRRPAGPDVEAGAAVLDHPAPADRRAAAAGRGPPAAPDQRDARPT